MGWRVRARRRLCAQRRRAPRRLGPGGQHPQRHRGRQPQRAVPVQHPPGHHRSAAAHHDGALLVPDGRALQAHRRNPRAQQCRRRRRRAPRPGTTGVAGVGRTHGSRRPGPSCRTAARRALAHDPRNRRGGRPGRGDRPARARRRAARAGVARAGRALGSAARAAGDGPLPRGGRPRRHHGRRATAVAQQPQRQVDPLRGVLGCAPPRAAALPPRPVPLVHDPLRDRPRHPRAGRIPRRLRVGDPRQRRVEPAVVAPRSGRRPRHPARRRLQRPDGHPRPPAPTWRS